ncbi:MAG: hypothetical protein GWN77_06620, partial [Gammaproteobacteria bacterium]|nr:hypothetical protein [Gammaproteobacteria bacterium]
MLDGVTFGPYRVEHGQVQIPREGLSLDMAPSANGVEVGLGTNIQVALDPDTIPVDSLSFLEMSADISITAPFGIVPGTDINMGIIFEGLPRNNVVVSITSGDPIGPITDTLIAEYIHNLYQENAEVFPHTITLTGQSSLGHTFDVFVEFYDDPSDPARQISVQRPDPDHVSVTIP